MSRDPLEARRAPPPCVEFESRSESRGASAVPGQLRRRHGGWELTLSTDWEAGLRWLLARLSQRSGAWLVVDTLGRLATESVAGAGCAGASVSVSVCVFVPGRPEEVLGAIELALAPGVLEGVALVEPEGLDGLWPAVGPWRSLWAPLSRAVQDSGAALLVVRGSRRRS